MLTGRISSGTQEHPSPTDVYRALLPRMVERGVESSWAHFEVVGKGGWFKNLLHGKEPWVGVACVEQQTVQLNLGVSKPKRATMPSAPHKWRQDSTGLLTVPTRDIDELTIWLDRCLASLSGSAAYRVSGWIEGL